MSAKPSETESNTEVNPIPSANAVKYVSVVKYGNIASPFIPSCPVCKKTTGKNVITFGLASKRVVICLKHVSKPIYWSPNFIITKIAKNPLAGYYHCLNCNKRASHVAGYASPVVLAKRLLRLKTKLGDEVLEINNETAFSGDFCKKCLVSYSSPSAFMGYLKGEYMLL